MTKGTEMTKRTLSSVFLILMLCCVSARSEDYGTVTLTERQNGSMSKLIYAWISDATGRASVSSDKYYTGKIMTVRTIPGTSTNQPTDNYDVEITDSDSHDVLLAAGANRDSTDSETIVSASAAAVVDSKLILSVTNAGNAKRGTVVLWMQD